MCLFDIFQFVSVETATSDESSVYGGHLVTALIACQICGFNYLSNVC